MVEEKMIFFFTKYLCTDEVTLFSCREMIFFSHFFKFYDFDDILVSPKVCSQTKEMRKCSLSLALLPIALLNFISVDGEGGL